MFFRRRAETAAHELAGVNDDPLTVEDLTEDITGTAASWRDRLAELMWNEYRTVLQARGMLDEIKLINVASYIFVFEVVR